MNLTGLSPHQRLPNPILHTFGGPTLPIFDGSALLRSGQNMGQTVLCGSEAKATLNLPSRLTYTSPFREVYWVIHPILVAQSYFDRAQAKSRQTELCGSRTVNIFPSYARQVQILPFTQSNIPLLGYDKLCWPHPADCPRSCPTTKVCEHPESGS